MSMALVFRKALIERLKATSAVSDLVGDRVYGGTSPVNEVYPFIAMHVSSMVADDADCITGKLVTYQVDIWSREAGNDAQATQILDAAYDALHMTTLALDDPFANVECNVVFANVFDDPDGITTHGVLRVAGMIEDTA